MIRLLKMYNGIPAGPTPRDFGKGVETELIRRGIAEEIAPVQSDPDGDGKAEGGRDGEKKAFSGPPDYPELRHDRKPPKGKR